MSDGLSVEQVMQKWRDRSTLTDEQLHSAAMDCMDLVAATLEAGGQLYAGYDDGWFKRKYVLLDVVIPGVTTA